MKLRILLADDHHLVRDALRIMLEKDPTMLVVAETGVGLEVLNLARQTHPDVVCMDINMPGMNGIDTTRRLVAACPAVKVIALSSLGDQRYVIEMLEAGASAYVTKASVGDELRRAIKAVTNGQKYLCPSVAGALATTQNAKGTSQEPVGESSLSSRERQVLQLVAEGHSSTQISELLFISPTTVGVHRRNIMRKLNLHSVADLTKFAVRYGLTIE
jgi:two-component system NarL family response regulator